MIEEIYYIFNVPVVHESGLVPPVKEDGHSFHCHHCRNRRKSHSASSPWRYGVGGVAPQHYLERKKISIPALHDRVHFVISLIPRLS